MSAVLSPRCQNCIHAGVVVAHTPADETQTAGMQCRRYPPHVMAIPVGRDPVTGGARVELMTMWPGVRPTDGCGEFQPQDLQAFQS